MYLNISSWQILTECLFCTKNYASHSGKYKSRMIPGLCSQSCVERLNEPEIAKQCHVRIRASGRGTDCSSFGRRKHFQGAEVEWTDDFQGWCRPGGLTWKSWVGGEEKQAQATQGQWREHSCRDRKEYIVFEVLVWPNWGKLSGKRQKSLDCQKPLCIQSWKYYVATRKALKCEMKDDTAKPASE